MPAYSFKERFVPFVEDGSKPHTIRNYRKYPVKRGDNLYLYFGLRTKFARKLRQEKCTDVQTIAIAANGNVVIVHRSELSKNEINRLKHLISRPHLFIKDELLWGIPVDVLNDQAKDYLAWKDGFRPEGTTLDNCSGCFAGFLQFFKQMHPLPFVGNIIYWSPKSSI